MDKAVDHKVTKTIKCICITFLSYTIKQNSVTVLCNSGAGSFGLFSCVLDGVERQQSHRAVYR